MKALDLFAGTGGGVACQELGIDEVGVEIMPAAIETRAANGMETLYEDVWEGLLGAKDRDANAVSSYGFVIKRTSAF
jgi:DNA (cytosine-5)-methyltransferase 1